MCIYKNYNIVHWWFIIAKYIDLQKKHLFERLEKVYTIYILDPAFSENTKHEMYKKQKQKRVNPIPVYCVMLIMC